MFNWKKNKHIVLVGFTFLWAVLFAWQEMISPAIGITMIILIADFFIYRDYQIKFELSQLLLPALFVFYAIGLLWSDHVDIGAKLLEYKISFFIFPLLFLYHKKNIDYRLVLYGILLGCYLLIARLIFSYMQINEDISFYEISRKEVLLHPTYLCIYFSAGIAVSWYLYLEFRSRFRAMPAIINTLIFSLFIVLSQSLAGILFLLLLLTFLTAWWIYRKWKLIGVIIYFIIVPIGGFFVLKNLPFLKYDFEVLDSVYHEIQEGKLAYLNKNKDEISGNKERVVMWFISSEIIAENPFGVGLGDIDFVIAEKAKKYELSSIQQTPLNPHNQFLQIGIDIGVPGILFLLFILFYLTYLGIESKNLLLIFIVASLLFNSFFESVLQRQSGIIFYAFFITLALVIFRQQKSLTDKNC